MADDRKKNIVSALDKMESEYEGRAKENKIVRTVEKHSYKKEIQTEKIIKDKKVQEHKEFQTFEFKSRTTQGILIFALIVYVVLNLSRDQRTTLVEYSIYTILLAGIVAAKKKN